MSCMPYTNYTWITDRLAIGGWVADSDQLPFDAILSMETHAPPGIREMVLSGEIAYEWRSIIDGISHEEHGEIVRRFDAAAALIDEWLRGDKRVLVHCYAGASRSVTAVIWYLMQYEGYSWDDALTLIHRQRNIANPNIRFEIPLRIANGEDLDERWIERRIREYCDKMRTDFNIEVDPQEIRETLERQGTLDGKPLAS